MTIQTEQPRTDVDALVKLMDSGVDVAASPHVGNLNQTSNPHYLALGKLLGVRIEMVDTISVDDKHGRPTIKVAGDAEQKLVNLSRREMGRLLPVGVQIDDSETLESLHVNAALASGIKAQTITGSIAEIGLTKGFRHGEVLNAVALSCDSLMRVARGGQISGDPAMRAPNTSLSRIGLFGTGEDVKSGLIIPVTAMAAAEVIAATINNQDTTAHIGGSDMVKYGTTPEFVQSVEAITNKALALLAVRGPGIMRYVILDKNDGIDGLTELSSEIADKLGLSNFSQHDTIGLDLPGRGVSK